MVDNFGFTVGGVPDTPRRRKQASTRLLHEWSIMQPWVVPPFYEEPLGPTPLTLFGDNLDPKVIAMMRRYNRRADLIGVTASEIQVVEAKMVATPGAISQLQHYVHIVYLTPVLRQFAPRAIQPVLVWAVDDELVSHTARAAGIRVEVFTPSWTQDYLKLKFFG